MSGDGRSRSLAISKPDRRNWNISSRAASKGLYALALVNIEPGSRFFSDPTSTLRSMYDIGSNKSTDIPTEFVFNMNPRNITMDEPASTTIVPTQDGGQFIESHGQLYKNISIRGTTGLRPNRQILPVIEVALTVPIPSLDFFSGLPFGEKSGFEDFIDLRNMFRLYWSMKRDAASAYKTVMVWQNVHEEEFYIVEPITFRTEKDSSSPVTFSYDIQLRTIQRVDIAELTRARLDIFKNTIRYTRNAERIKQSLNNLVITANSISTFIDRTALIPASTINSVLTPVNGIIQGLAGIITSGRRFTPVIRDTVLSTQEAVKGVWEDLEALVEGNDPYTEDGILTSRASVTNSLKSMARSLLSTYSEDSIYTEDVGERVSRQSRQYRTTASGSIINSGSPTNLENVNIARATQQVGINKGETIQTLALRTLGDAAKWKDLVILNDLKAPYISASGDGKRVLRPGDNILVPSSASRDETSVLSDLTNTTDVLVKRLGRDLKLKNTSAIPGASIFDIDISNNGDLRLIEGKDNIEQALEIKFRTEQGTLPTHPYFGVQIPIGSKLVARSITAFQMNARGSILADGRIESVDNISVTTDGNVVNINADIRIQEIDKGLQLGFSTRR